MSRPAGSRNGARSVEPGKLLYRYTRPKGECTAKCCLCTCTLASSVYATCGTQTHKQLFYIEVIHSKSRCRWRRLLRSSPLSVFLSLRKSCVGSSLSLVSRLALSIYQTHLTFTSSNTIKKEREERTLY